MQLPAQLLLWSVVRGQDLPSMESWSYQYQQYWDRISGAKCGKSQSQSPIDIPKQMSFVQQKNLTPLAGQNGMYLGPLAWSLEKTRLNVTLHPGPLTWEVLLNKPDEVLLQLDGRSYSLERITFKSPSEHTVQGSHNSMEVELHHASHSNWKDSRKRLVASVSFKERSDAWNGWLDSLFSAMPDGKVGSALIANPYLELTPPDKSFVTYHGSTTVPPCHEAVWVVFLQPQYMNVKQLLQFRSSISGYQPSRLSPANSTRPSGVSELWDSRWGDNNRRVQALGDRSLMLVQMLNVKAAPKLGIVPGAQDNTLLLVVFMMLAAILATGCILVFLMRMKRSSQGSHGAWRSQGGCCDESDDEEDVDVRQFGAPGPLRDGEMAGPETSSPRSPQQPHSRGLFGKALPGVALSTGHGFGARRRERC